MSKKSNSDGQKVHRKGSWKIPVILFGVLIIAYLCGVIYFSSHFFPNTTIGDTDYSFKNKEQMAEQIADIPMDIKFCLTGREGTFFNFTSSDVGMYYKVDGNLINTDTDYKAAFSWPVYIWKSNAMPMSAAVEYDNTTLMSFLSKQSLFDSHTAKEPEDAYIGEYDSASGEFVIVPETEGSQLDMKSTLVAIDNAIDTITLDTTELDIDLEAEGCYKTAIVTSDSESLKEALDVANSYLGANITLDCNGGTEVLDRDTIAQWLVTNGSEIAIDPLMVQSYVEELASKYDTYNTYVNFNCADGSVRTLKKGDYGWAIDVDAEIEQLTEDITEGRTVEREPEYSSRGYVKGYNDIGNSYVEVNMSAQHLYLWVNGAIILESDVVTGDMATGCATPAGIYGITFKKQDTTLRGSTWEDYVYYWMPFYGNYGMHDATWRDKFGGDIFTNNGSHGCVNLPLDHAAAIYNTVTVGFPVICYY